MTFLVAMSDFTAWFEANKGEIIAVLTLIGSSALSVIWLYIRAWLKKQKMKAETQLSLLSTISDNSVTKPIWNMLRDEIGSLGNKTDETAQAVNAHVAELRKEFGDSLSTIGTMLSTVFKDTNITAEAKDKLLELDQRLRTNSDAERLELLAKEVAQRDELIAELQTKLNAVPEPVVQHAEPVVKTERKKVRL